MELKIKDNPQTGGQYTVFSIGDEFFYADRSYIPFTGMETMIFSCDKDGHVSDWTELYCDRSESSLKDCIEEFIKEYILR